MSDASHEGGVGGDADIDGREGRGVRKGEGRAKKERKGQSIAQRITSQASLVRLKDSQFYAQPYSQFKFHVGAETEALSLKLE